MRVTRALLYVFEEVCNHIQIYDHIFLYGYVPRPCLRFRAGGQARPRHVLLARSPQYCRAIATECFPFFG
jgi:hypothetical protein